MKMPAALFAVAALAVLCIGGLADAPARAHAFQPAVTEAAQSSSPTPSPRLLGHLVVSAICTTFIERFDAAATTMIADDVLLDDASIAIRGYEDDFSHLDGAARSWNHRLQLIAALKDLLGTISKTQATVNDLRSQAATIVEADRRAAVLEAATHLQESVDHQRIVADELTGVVDLTLDLHTSEDTIARGAQGILDPKQSFNVQAGDAPVPHPGDALPARVSSVAPALSATEFVLHVPRDRRVIEHAESSANSAITRFVRSCVQTSLPAPP